MDEIPEIGSTWRHRDGGHYTVLLIANEPNSERYPLMIVYKDVSSRIWARRADDWHRSMTKESSS